MRVLDATGTQVAAAEGASGSIRIDGVTPWRPGAAYLYGLMAEIVDGGGTVRDTIPSPSACAPSK